MYVENSTIYQKQTNKNKTTTKNTTLVELNEFSKPIEYKVNIQMSTAFLYISNKQLLNKIKRITIYSNFKNHKTLRG